MSATILPVSGSVASCTSPNVPSPIFRMILNLLRSRQPGRARHSLRVGAGSSSSAGPAAACEAAAEPASPAEAEAAWSTAPAAPSDAARAAVDDELEELLLPAAAEPGPASGAAAEAAFEEEEEDDEGEGASGSVANAESVVEPVALDTRGTLEAAVDPATATGTGAGLVAGVGPAPMGGGGAPPAWAGRDGPPPRTPLERCDAGEPWPAAGIEPGPAPAAWAGGAACAGAPGAAPLPLLSSGCADGAAERLASGMGGMPPGALLALEAPGPAGVTPSTRSGQLATGAALLDTAMARGARPLKADKERKKQRAPLRQLSRQPRLQPCEWRAPSRKASPGHAMCGGSHI